MRYRQECTQGEHERATRRWPCCNIRLEKTQSIQSFCAVRMAWILTVKEDGSKVTHNVDHEEDGTLLRLHRQIAAIFVTSYRMSFRRLDQEIVDGTWTAQNIRGSVGSQGENDYNDQEDKGMDPVCQDGGLQASHEGICYVVLRLAFILAAASL